MPERQIVGPPATTGGNTPKITKQPEQLDGDEATQEMNEDDEAQGEVVEVLLGSLIQLLIAKRLITAEEFETFVQTVMNKGVDIDSKQPQVQPQQMAGPQPAQGGQQGSGFPGSANQPSAGGGGGFGQNNLQK